MNTSVSDELLEQELVMRQCIEQLESCERSHATFCSDLKDALLEQVLPCLCYCQCTSVAVLFVFSHEFQSSIYQGSYVD